MDVGNGGPSYGCHVGPQDMTIINQIMRRFRPIAPKPVAVSSAHGSKQEGNKTEPVSKRRRKRKYIRVKKNRKLWKNRVEKEERKAGSSLEFGDHGSVITLQLLPESSSSVTNPPDIFAVNSPDLSDRKMEMLTVKESEHPTQYIKAMGRASQDTINSFENPYAIDKGQVYPRRTSESWVMLEGMTKAFVDGEAMASFDMEKMKNVEMLMMVQESEYPIQNFRALDKVCQNTINSCGNPYTIDKGQIYPLTQTARTSSESWVMVEGMTKASVDMEIKMKNVEMDTCPWLISDGLGKVQWVNTAYRRMVADPLEDSGGPPLEMVVRLVVKEKITHLRTLQFNDGSSNPVFACSVRVVYTWGKSKYSQIMPCDVWKLEFGGFAWRLDTEAALSLGR